MTTFGTFVALKVSQPVTSMQPSAFCEWGCGAQTCRIQLSDDLPQLFDLAEGMGLGRAALYRDAPVEIVTA
jgi:hypothetical protein